ncbi:SulP family inorganic anion transporter [Methylogaea oryzae]|uniref:Sulfate transporter n=1 Tax=Methylogaea oryzae TaxID=1295382 RepID=A0A8D4VTB8_9GAMM|nr:SulP family inorganic anion transporter [Methylogaea oryzae]BBL72222.1 sulfate transporter [Methylogaea oryzae]
MTRHFRSDLATLQQHWRQDAPAGFLVFLVALPLCLGIAIASGFPPMAGIITAVVGGLLVSRLGSSQLAVTGPAAGLIVVILAAVESLGQGDDMAGYHRTLAAIVVAGLIQIALGYFKAGRLSAFFPLPVVHGMLAAIGIIIMAKQLHVLMGVHSKAATLLQAIGEVPSSLVHFNPQIAAIGAVCLAILLLWPLVSHPALKRIPAPLLVVASGLLLGQFFELDHYRTFFSLPPFEYSLGPQYLLPVPDNFFDNFYAPDFSQVFSTRFWGAVISICLVGSLETLLVGTAVDKLDPERRSSDLNRDLVAVGVGNAVAGLLGGLPMIVEIVRSSTAIENGAKSAWTNFFHGAFLLLFVALFPRLLHEIPLASLAALLVYTGYRLASPSTFAAIAEVGAGPLAVFVVTIVGVLATDLLMGVLIGIAAKLLLTLLSGVSPANLLKLAYRIERRGDGGYHITVSGAAIFSNFIALKTELAALPAGGSIVFDLSESDLIDHTVMDLIDEFRRDYTAKGGACRIHGLENHKAASDHPLAARKRDGR